MTFMMFFRVSEKKVPLASLPSHPPRMVPPGGRPCGGGCGRELSCKNNTDPPHTHPCIVGFMGEKWACFCTILVNLAEVCILLFSFAQLLGRGWPGTARNTEHTDPLDV